MSSFLDSIKTVNVTHVDTTTDGPSRFHWRHGNKQARTSGFFYLNADDHLTEPTNPWQPCELYEGEQGYQTMSLRIAPIGYRSQWFKLIGDTRVWLQGYEEGARKLTEVLCFADGLDEPVVWSAKGLTGMAITAKGGILPAYRNGLLRQAKRVAGKDLPLWSFWLPIATKIDNHAHPVFEPTKHASVSITLPALHLPFEDHEANMDHLYVGAEYLRWGDEVIFEYADWLKAKRGTTEQEPPANVSTEQDDAPADVSDQGEDLQF